MLNNHINMNNLSWTFQALPHKDTSNFVSRSVFLNVITLELIIIQFVRLAYDFLENPHSSVIMHKERKEKKRKAPEEERKQQEKLHLSQFIFIY